MTVSQSKNNSSGTGTPFEDPTNILSRNVDQYQLTLHNISEYLKYNLHNSGGQITKTFLAFQPIKAKVGVQVCIQTLILILAINGLSSPLHALSALPRERGGEV